MQPENYQPITTHQPPTTQQPQAESVLEGYTSNPFLVGLKSLVATLKINPVATMLTPLILIGFLLLVGLFAIIAMLTRSTAGNIIAMFGIFIAYVGIIPWMLSAYYAITASSIRKEHINMSEAISRGFKKALPMLGLMILTLILVSLGFLLLIIPGIIILARISLAPAVLVTENTGVIAAISRSFALTKGHTTEMLGALMAGGIFGTNGILAPYFGVAQMAGRYQDLRALEESSTAKPPIHWLNILLVALIPVAIALYALIFTVAFKGAQDTAKRESQKTQLRYNNNLNYRYDY